MYVRSGCPISYNLSYIVTSVRPIKIYTVKIGLKKKIENVIYG